MTDSCDFVRNGSDIRFTVNEDLYYRTNDGRKKMAYIFNNFWFEGSPRYGTQEDCRRLNKCLTERDFTVQIFQEPVAKTVLDTVEKASKLKRTEVSCILIVIMSHGDRGVIHARNSSYYVNQLFTHFEEDHSELEDVPVLFFLQACRGDRLDAGREELDGPSRETNIPPRVDMLCAFSTTEEHISWRNNTFGAWFIQSLCDQLESRQQTNILHLLTLVNNQMAKRASSSDNSKIDNKKQIGHIESSLTKLLLF